MDKELIKQVAIIIGEAKPFEGRLTAQEIIPIIEAATIKAQQELTCKGCDGMRETVIADAKKEERERIAMQLQKLDSNSVYTFVKGVNNLINELYGLPG